MEELLFFPSTRLRDRIEYGDEIFTSTSGTASVKSAKWSSRLMDRIL
jgi:hypothetical protein